MNRYWLTLVCWLFCCLAARAVSDEELLQLETEMQQYFESGETAKFMQAANKLKELSKETNNERVFYKAWGRMAVYEASQQEFSKALDIVGEITTYAKENGSVYGEWASLHGEALVYLQKEDYEVAEIAFLKALDFRHRHFPNESDAEDLRELMKMALLNGDKTKAKKYGYQILDEPNLKPHHKGRTLDRLSTIAFEENNQEEFNRIYEEMERLNQNFGIKTKNLYVELNYFIINGDYKQALLLVDRLAPDSCAERKALIYHRLGDNEKAYHYMVLYKHLSDSIAQASHDRRMADLYLRMNNDRLRLERQALVHKNEQLHQRFWIFLAIAVIFLLLIVIYQRQGIIKLLKNDKTLLDSGKKEAELALQALNDLSYYESQEQLPLNMPVRVNKLCDHLTDFAQRHCHRGVITMFQTDMADDFEITTNSDALEKMLSTILNDSIRFTQQGNIKLLCTDADDSVRFCISDTSQKDENLQNMSITICQSICRLIHGHIEIDRQFADGNRYYIQIPKQT